MLTNKSNEKRDMNIINLKIKDGSFICTGRQTNNRFNSISGAVTGILLKDHDDKDGERFKLWHLRMLDKEANEKYDISFAFKSQAFKTVLLSLVSAEGQSHINDVELRAYKAHQASYTNAAVYADGERVHWAECLLPAPKYHKVDDEYTKSNDEEMETIMHLVDVVNKVAKSGRTESLSRPASHSGDSDAFRKALSSSSYRGSQR